MSLGAVWGGSADLRPRRGRRVPARAMTGLATKGRPEAGRGDAFFARHYPPAEVETAVARVRELGYLDEGEVARARARSLLGRSAAPRLAARRLEAQGIDPVLARTAVDAEAGEEGEAGLLERALQRRVKGRKVDDKEKQRVFRSLV